MRPVLIAIGAALVSAVPGYLIGRAVRNRALWYRLLFWGEIAVMVPVVAWALIVGYVEVAAVSIGTTFGLINGMRHGYSPAFGPLIAAGRQREDERL